MVGIGLAGTPFAGRFSDAPRHNRSLVSGWTRAAPLPGPHPLPLAPLHQRQRRLRLGQPEGHVHRRVHLDGRGQLGAGLLTLAGGGIQRAQPVVTVGLEGAHTKFVGQDQGLLVGPAGAFKQEPTVLNKSLCRKCLSNGI